MTSQSGNQTTAIHKLSIISRSKANQTMKFGQLIECNMRNISLEESYAKSGLVEKLVPYSFLKNQNWELLLIKSVILYNLQKRHLKAFCSQLQGLAL